MFWIFRIGIITVVLLASICGFGQKETQTRLLSSRYTLTFKNAQPVYTYHDTPFYDANNPGCFNNPNAVPYPNSICDTLGNLLFYYDGFNVYNSNREVMQNGALHTHSFSSSFNYCTIIPIEESNRRLYYIVEAVPYEANWDSNAVLNKYINFYFLCKLQYHVVDVNANKGGGGGNAAVGVHCRFGGTGYRGGEACQRHRYLGDDAKVQDEFFADVPDQFLRGFRSLYRYGSGVSL